MSTEDTKQHESVSDTFTNPKPHHISDTDVWGPPDRNYYIFVVLSILLGFFGLDHFYLRSNETAMKKFLLNIAGLGIWYIWDIIQVLQDGKLVRKEGLNSPFDWIRGIGRGAFMPLPADMTKEERAEAKDKKFEAPKSYVVYTILAVCFGFLGLDKFYLGENWKGFAKLFSTVNIFLFLFGLFWVVWDAFHAIFMTKSILEDGITAPIPFSFLFKKPIDAKTLFKVQPVVEKPEEDSGFGFLSFLRSLYTTFMVPLLQPTVRTAIGSATKLASAGTAAAALGTSLLSQGPGAAAAVAQQVKNDTLQTVQKLAQTQAMMQPPVMQPQAGGGSGDLSSGPGPVLGGALTALLIAGAAKGVSDFLSRR
jgi:TM2 domain-containing membrane protein YozV